MFEKQKFVEFMLERKVVGFFDRPVKLKSGRMSRWYVNWRSVSEDVYSLDRLTDFVLEYVKENQLSADCFYGVPEGGSKLALLTQYKWAKSSANYGADQFKLCMGRGKPKEHGDKKDRFFLGRPAGDVIIVEDVSTTGGSLLEVVESFEQEEDINIKAVLVMTDRVQKRADGKMVTEVLSEKNIPFYSLSAALDILPLAYQMHGNSDEELKTSLLAEYPGAEL